MFTAGDRASLHRLDAIQPHGILLIADTSLVVRGGAGAIEEQLCTDWIGRELTHVLDLNVALTLPHVERILSDMTVETSGGQHFTVHCVKSGKWVLVELEPMTLGTLSPRAVLAQIDHCAAQFERCVDIAPVFDLAAEQFRRLTDFDRVMIYQFLEDGTAHVVAESGLVTVLCRYGILLRGFGLESERADAAQI